MTDEGIAPTLTVSDHPHPTFADARPPSPAQAGEGLFLRAADAAAILVIDQGTTSTRAIVFGPDALPVAIAQEEFRQIYPHPGWVEHDPEDLWRTTLVDGAHAPSATRPSAGLTVAALGITNQRETALVWDRKTGAADPQRHRVAGPAHGRRSAPT